MSLFGILATAFAAIATVVTGVVKIAKKFEKKSYDFNSVDDSVDADAVLQEMKEEIEKKIKEEENVCMNIISSLFSELKEKTREQFPDLVEIIEKKEADAQTELKGTFIKYVREKMSTSNLRFRAILEKPASDQKSKEIDNACKNILKEAERLFFDKLKNYANDILREFTDRLNQRIINQEQQTNSKLDELQRLQSEAESGRVNIEALRDAGAPAVEAAGCILEELKEA